MKKFLLVIFVLTITCSYSQEVKTLLYTNQPDSVLVVINGTQVGILKDVKKDIYKMPTDLIESMNVLKGEAAIKKYGDKGKAGVIEIVLKEATIMEGKIVQQDNPGGDSVFSKVEIESYFPGGDRAWRSYLEKNLNADLVIDSFVPPGSYTVIVQFVVDKQGNISEVKPLTNHGYGMEQEVMRVVSKGPKWAPAVLHGGIVKAYRKQPVTFQTIGEFELSTYKLKAGEATIIELKGVDSRPHEISIHVTSGSIMPIGGNKYSITVEKPGYVHLTVSQAVKKKWVELGTIALKVE